MSWLLFFRVQGRREKGEAATLGHVSPWLFLQLGALLLQIRREFCSVHGLRSLSGMTEKPYDIRERTYLFTREVVAFGRQVVTLRDFVLSRLVYQLVDAAGSVGSNLEEAGDGQTKPDFINKNCIALEEIREAKFWLRQLRDAEPKRLGTLTASLIQQSEELKSIVSTIILNAKKSKSRGEDG